MSELQLDCIHYLTKEKIQNKLTNYGVGNSPFHSHDPLKVLHKKDVNGYKYARAVRTPQPVPTHYKIGPVECDKRRPSPHHFDKLIPTNTKQQIKPFGPHHSPPRHRLSVEIEMPRIGNTFIQFSCALFIFTYLKALLMYSRYIDHRYYNVIKNLMNACNCYPI